MIPTHFIRKLSLLDEYLIRHLEALLKSFLK